MTPLIVWVLLGALGAALCSGTVAYVVGRGRGFGEGVSAGWDGGSAAAQSSAERLVRTVQAQVVDPGAHTSPWPSGWRCFPAGVMPVAGEMPAQRVSTAGPPVFTVWTA